MATPTIDKFTKQIIEVSKQAPGVVFKIIMTDAEATAAVKEYIEENREQVKELIKKSTKVGIDVTDPEIKFFPNRVDLSAKGKKGILKIKASASANVTWDGMLHVEATSVDVPIISISPEEVNPLIKELIGQFIKKAQEYIEIRSFQITTGSACLEGTNKNKK